MTRYTYYWKLYILLTVSIAISIKAEFLKEYNISMDSIIPCQLNKIYVPSPIEISWFTAVDRIGHLNGQNVKNDTYKNWHHGCIKMRRCCGSYGMDDVLE